MRMTKCPRVGTHFYDADRYDSCPHCAKLSGTSLSQNNRSIHPESSSKSGEPKDRDSVPPAKKDSSKSDKAEEQSSKKHGFFGHRKSKLVKDDRTKAVWDEDDEPDSSEIIETNEEEPEIAEEVHAATHSNEKRRSEIPLEETLVETESKDAEPEQPSFSQQIRNVAMSGNVKDLKTVAYYNYEDNNEPVVGWVVATNTDEKGNSFELKCGKNTIGRSGNGQLVDISLDHDTTISRGTQAIIIYEPKKRHFLVQNANGSSLVYYNDDLLMAFNELSAYDRITIGETELLFIPLCSDRFTWEK